MMALDRAGLIKDYKAHFPPEKAAMMEKHADLVTRSANVAYRGIKKDI